MVQLQAWIEKDVLQCGYCQTGMLRSAAALLAKNSKSTEGEVNQAISNLCRCGSYPRIHKTIQRVTISA